MVRIWPLRALPGFGVEYNGLEVQILDSKSAGYYDTGAIYDLVKPTTNAMRPVGEWNHMRINCNESALEVWINDIHVNRMNLDEWNARLNARDGSEHKFSIAWKYHSRTGFIGLQKHGGNCWLKNIKLKPLG